MTFAQAILAAILLWPRHFSDANEPPDERLERLTIAAQSEAEACNVSTCFEQSDTCRPIYHDRAECAGALTVLAGVESGFAAHVHRGECRPHECDRGRAVGLWQTHRLRAWDDPSWESMRGDSLEATTATAIHTARLIAGGVGQCGSLAGSLSRYNNGRRCDAYKFEAMARRAQQVAAQIRVRMAQK